MTVGEIDKMPIPTLKLHSDNYCDKRTNQVA